jgi:hypothetical protein|tara:strand:- start:3919 stop:4170 length:252 start_codon:yes stop_codon:yes gene_type:complete
MMINKTHEGKWIRLKGISGHGKNRIREHGDLWFVIRVHENKIHLRSRNKTFKCGGVLWHDGRWIDSPTDKNFEIVGIEWMVDV